MKQIRRMVKAERDELDLLIKEEIGRGRPDKALVVCMKMMRKQAELEDAIVELQEIIKKK